MNLMERGLNGSNACLPQAGILTDQRIRFSLLNPCLPTDRRSIRILFFWVLVCPGWENFK